MNAIEDDPEIDEFNAEYNRLKPLRDLEKTFQDNSVIPSWRQLFALILVTALWTQIVEKVLTADSFVKTHHMDVPVFFAWAGLISLLWADHGRRANRAQWAAVAQTLRALAQEVNELRSAKK